MKIIIFISASVLLLADAADANFLGTMQFSKVEFLNCAKNSTSRNCESIIQIGCESFCTEEEMRLSEMKEACNQLCVKTQEQDHMKVASASEINNEKH